MFRSGKIPSGKRSENLKGDEMKIITLTLNPAIDVHCHADSFQLYRESVADVTERDAGGKGINMSVARSILFKYLNDN